METKTVTRLVLGGTVGGLLIYEAWTLINKSNDDTISESVWEMESGRPILPFLAGLLCGHFFFPKGKV